MLALMYRLAIFNAFFDTLYISTFALLAPFVKGNLPSYFNKFSYTQKINCFQDVISILNKHVLPMVKEEKESVLESKGAKMAAGKKKK